MDVCACDDGTEIPPASSFLHVVRRKIAHRSRETQASSVRRCMVPGCSHPSDELVVLDTRLLDSKQDDACRCPGRGVLCGVDRFDDSCCSHALGGRLVAKNTNFLSNLA